MGSGCPARTACLHPLASSLGLTSRQRCPTSAVPSLCFLSPPTTEYRQQHGSKEWWSHSTDGAWGLDSLGGGKLSILLEHLPWTSREVRNKLVGLKH